MMGGARGLTERFREWFPLTQIAGALLGVAAGILLTASLQSMEQAREPQSEASLTLLAQEAALSQEREWLLGQVESLEVRILQMENVTAQTSEESALTRMALERTRALSGQTDMRGPGVKVVLDDAPRESIAPGDDIKWYIVHDVDVLRVVNRLRGAGAECISINGERLLSNSRIRCGGPTIHVKDRPLTPPFEILAIGDPDALYRSLADPAPDGGMSELEILSFFGIRAGVSREDDVLVPRYIGDFSFRYARAAGAV